MRGLSELESDIREFIQKKKITESKICFRKMKEQLTYGKLRGKHQ